MENGLVTADWTRRRQCELLINIRTVWSKKKEEKKKKVSKSLF